MEPVLDHDPRELSADLRLLPAALGAWGTAWCAVLFTAAQVAVAVVTLVLVVGSGYVLSKVAVPAPARGESHRARRREQWSAQLALTAAAAATVGLSSAAQLGATRSDLAALVERGVVAEVEATISSDPRPLVSPWSSPEAPAQSYLLTIRTHQIEARAEQPGARRRLNLGAELTVIAPSSWATVQRGERIRTWGRLSPQEPGRRAVGVLRPGAGPDIIAAPAWWWRAAERPRAALRDSVSRFPDPGAGLLPSLVVGDTSLLDDRVIADLSDSGLTHLTAVSGANVAIVLGSLLAVANLCGVTPRWRLLIAIVGLIGFVILARPEPSVLRAAAMGGIAVRAMVFSRRRDALPILNVAVISLLVWDPWLARQPGFALSAVATAALVLLVPGWQARLSRRMPRIVALPLAATCAAQAGCAPILVLLQPTVSTVAVPANLLAGPAVFPATVAGMLAAALGSINAVLATPFAAFGWVATTWIATVARLGAALPGAAVPWLSGFPGAILMAVVVASLVLLARRIRPIDSDRRAPSRGPAASVFTRRRLILTGSVLLLALAGLLRYQARAGVPRDWAVAMCDVGQGDATVLRSGPNSGVLIDVGPDAERVDACLHRLEITSLDAVLLSHFHADHVLGLAGALRGRQVRHVELAPLQAPSFGVDSVRSALAADASDQPGATDAGGPKVDLARDAAHEATGASGWSVAWTLLVPIGLASTSTSTSSAAARSALGSTTDHDGTTINESSVVVWATVTTPSGAQIVVAALGDLEEEGQRALLTRLQSPLGADPVVDVVKVAHHGSRHQEAALYQLLDPAVALIGVGANNDYGHPAPSALQMLHDAGAVVKRSDQAGLITISAMGSGDRPDLVVATD